MASEISRNDPCPCGSGLKYKKCCSGKPAPLKGKRLVVFALLICGVLGLVTAVTLTYGFGKGLGVGVAALLALGILFVTIRPPPSGRGRGRAGDINFGR